MGSKLASGSTAIKTDLRWSHFSRRRWRVLAEGLHTDLLLDAVLQMEPFPQDMASGKVNGQESVTHHLEVSKRKHYSTKDGYFNRMCENKPEMFQGKGLQKL